MNAIKEGESSRDELLGILLESNLKEVEEHGNGFGMSLQVGIGECKLFYIAGQETTAGLLVWSMILLSKHLDWQDLAREEVLQTFGKAKPDFDKFNQLHTITMILYEALRLYPPFALLDRMTMKDTTLGKLSLPAGVQLLLPTILLHQDCELWGDDAKEFNPNRFSEGISKATKGQLSYFPIWLGTSDMHGTKFFHVRSKDGIVYDFTTLFFSTFSLHMLLIL